MVSAISTTLLATVLNLTQPIQGTYALPSGEPKTAGHLTAMTVGKSKLDERMDLWLTDRHGATVRRYAIDMTKYIHLIVISQDFTTFVHLHPALTPGGHFRVDFHFPRAGSYYVYADCEPETLGQQVIRFDVSAGDATAGTRDLSPTGNSVVVDGYRVALSTVKLRANADTTMTVRITKDGKLANDLRPYLGALAHAVFIDGSDLSYLHVHPVAIGAPAMSMSGNMASMHMDEAPLPDNAPSAAAMKLEAHVIRPGTYKLWLQFRGGGKLHVAAFVLHSAGAMPPPV